MQRLLPLFPLPNVVLFPGMTLGLHIFEPRYKQMIEDVLQEDACFGIQLCQEYDPITMIGKPFDVGTIATISDCQHLPEGYKNIVVVGTQRFQVDTYHEAQTAQNEKPYLRGDVTLLESVSTGNMTQKTLQSIATLFEAVLQLTAKILERPYTPINLPLESEALSYLIAEHLKGSLVLKQQLLEENSPRERLLMERETLEKMVKMLAAQSQIESAFRGTPDSGL